MEKKMKSETINKSKIKNKVIIECSLCQEQNVKKLGPEEYYCPDCDSYYYDDDQIKILSNITKTM